MEVLICVVVGGLFAAGLYLILRRNAFSLLIGLVVFSHGVNLLLLSSGGLTRGGVPILHKQGGADALADPLPQALILTAIVIGVGVQTFVLVLIFRLVRKLRSADLAHVRSTEGEQVS